MDKKEHEVRMRILLLQEEFEVKRLKKIGGVTHQNICVSDIKLMWAFIFNFYGKCHFEYL